MMPSLQQQQQQQQQQKQQHQKTINNATINPATVAASSSSPLPSSLVPSSSASASSSSSSASSSSPLSSSIAVASSPASNAKMPYGIWNMDEPTRNRLLKQYRTQAASAASTIFATLSVTPLENLKTRMQTHDFRGLTDCARYIWRTEGFRGYTAGALPPMVSVTFVRVTNFTVYQKAKYALSDAIERMTGEAPLVLYNTPGSLPTLGTVSCFTIAGMVAGLAATPLACPFELAKNVVQTSVLMANRSHAIAGTATNRHTSLRGMPRLGTIDAIKQIVSRHGYRGLYTGVRLHAIRDTIGTGLYFGIYETAKQLISTYLGDQQSPFGAPMAAGALSGVIPWICTYTLDTKKTRAQCILLGKSKEIGEASMAAARSSMYKGMSVSIARTAFQNMILLTTFEYLKVRINQLEA
ncbi:mitochondrial carrier protein [Blastomyces dermatitidis ER-3]|uniref:Mitochondrial carrier protein n=3 Tax=Blastomyces TaxID=229219 RepID=A0A179UW19_BLAGS|nr:mitochondrial carrier protein [Blastomyces gilchristii SLH14081]XP_045271726.1 mitochondrial carrier protein [Blastomyces dermatitidis ER-3]EGE85692.1 mitochondrial carrier protein [Blastomyces dermatitidis ATCC 18188]EQL28683.1 hypothetical protein BDFG_08596 [Blastomyces dermatitidis ATCC 26199]EEQ83564.2 mitochondrial carrier protein [Blastomyces dermatitidis ER-3]OAT11251.1 mitochondrial carrier protein [Blastomyces gilchristii SLH14081]